MSSIPLATDIYFNLSNGQKIPALGVGTSPPDNKPAVKEQVITAVKAGYRQIDTAWYYGTEQYVGEALKELFEEGVVKREELYIVTKYWPSLYNNPEESINQSLKRLQLDYVDLLLQHYPVAFKSGPDGLPAVPLDEAGNLVYDDDPVTGNKFIESYHKLEDLLENTSKVKAIGISNYSNPKLRKLLAAVKKHKPVVNQLEVHPLLPQQDIIDFNNQNGIRVAGFSPVGSGGAPVLKLPLINQLAEKYNVSPNEVANAYLILQGVPSLPRTSNLERIKTNIRLPPLTREERDQLYQLGVANSERFINEPWGRGLGLKWFKGDNLSVEFD